MARSLLALVFLAAAAVAPAGSSQSVERVLDGRMHHLRSGATREWTSFPAVAEGPSLTLVFEGAANASEQTLRVRHRDLKQSWRVLINGVEIARLPPDENDMITCWAVAPGVLKDGQNELRVTGPAGASDDVMIGEVALIGGPRREVLSEGRLRIVVTDRAGGRSIPSRITLTDERGVMLPVGTPSGGALAVRPGVVYTGNGMADLEVAAGRYVVHAGRGVEYSVATARVDVQVRGTTTQTLVIQREVDTTGWVAMDTHIHTLTHSRHGDAAIDEQMLAIAGEGVEAPVSTEHNLRIDFDAPARAAGVRSVFTPLVGSEVTTAVGHFNVWPLAAEGPAVDPRPADWTALAASIAATAPDAVVILNHGRDLHGKFRPLDPVRHIGLTGERRDAQPFPANAMEVINSGAVTTDPLALVEDWMGLLNRGVRVSPIGSSDSHDVARFFVGQGRTYVRAPDSGPETLDPAVLAAAVRRGAVLVSYGLLAEAHVGPAGPGGLATVGSGALEVRARVQGPSWARADRVVVYVNGVPRRTERVANPAGGGTKWEGQIALPRPRGDVFVVVVALGPGIDQPYWPTATPYQPTSPDFTPFVLGVSGAVFVDVDRNGRFDSAFAQAEDLVRTNRELPDLGRQLAGYDRGVVSQVASVLRSRDPAGFEAALEVLRKAAAPEVLEGLDAYRAAVSP